MPVLTPCPAARPASTPQPTAAEHAEDVVVDVVVRWAGTPLAVERIARGETFTLGAGAARQGHFVWDAEGLASPHQPLVVSRADGVWVCGVPGATLTLDGAVVPGVHGLHVRGGQRACVALGPLDVEVCEARAAAPVPAAHTADACFVRISGAALVLHAGFIGALLVAQVGPTRDAELELTRLLTAHTETLRATVNAPMRRDVAPPVAPPLAHNIAGRAGARRGGHEPPDPKPDARTLARGALAALGLGGGDAQTNVFGSDGPALGASLHAGNAADIGAGVRRGAGGVSGAAISMGSLGALGDEDRGDGGDDLAAPLIARKRSSVVTVEHVQHDDGLSREEVARVMASARSQVRACYERELGASPDLEGKVVLGFVIAPSGMVASASAVANTIAGEPGARLGACVERVVKRLAFPAPRGGGVVSVRYPFVLAVSG